MAITNPVYFPYGLVDIPETFEEPGRQTAWHVTTKQTNPVILGAMFWRDGKYYVQTEQQTWAGYADYQTAATRLVEAHYRARGLETPPLAFNQAPF